MVEYSATFQFVLLPLYVLLPPSKERIQKSWFKNIYTVHTKVNALVLHTAQGVLNYIAESAKLANLHTLLVDFAAKFASECSEKDRSLHN